MRDKIVDMAVEYAEEPLSWEVMSKYQIPSYKDSLKMVHNPQTLTDITVGKERLYLTTFCILPYLFVWAKIAMTIQLIYILKRLL